MGRTLAVASLKIACGALVLLAAVGVAPPAHAYRPFDGTDADVAEPKVFELELGPAHYYRQGSQSYLIAPALVLNLGLFERTELVVDAQEWIALGHREMGVPRGAFQGDDIFLKHIFREGKLQGKDGISIAAEGGLLTPEINGMSGLGASLDIILSYPWSWGTIHYNEWAQFTRDEHIDLYSGVIVEGPRVWPVRPVAEVFYDQEFAGDARGSLLLGAIWSAKDRLNFDVGVRGARVGDDYAFEARLGLTLALPLGPPPPEEK